MLFSDRPMSSPLANLLRTFLFTFKNNLGQLFEDPHTHTTHPLRSDHRDGKNLFKQVFLDFKLYFLSLYKEYLRSASIFKSEKVDIFKRGAT